MTMRLQSSTLFWRLPKKWAPSSWVRGPGNWLASPIQPLWVTLWEASGSVSPGKASHLQGSEWEWITGAGWECEVGELSQSMGGSKPVGALMYGQTVHAHLWVTFNSTIHCSLSYRVAMFVVDHMNRIELKILDVMYEQKDIIRFEHDHDLC